ncbi:hypothetical protein Dacet_2237 [Denitrovibrio acetiphilus DSM 12809]|uniref:Uncharacterized protein n=1 Tax=Denitrovibrio acetiphilus (strain DSM 12809 / NBRC 114555 / N2460) TaxID=522772 RepID=D4H2X6_DENA2|nr:hypothetical protein [Denitrovibrio acetiphilus]ADD68999.1 hypothetical protein Dacet_2237 [Denitrovibrio acetiphilus DSM 12809]
MIQIAGITLPMCAVWENELESGQPEQECEICADGTELIYQNSTTAKIDIYIPKISGELTRETVLRLKSLSQNASVVSLNINGALKKALFRHSDKALDLKPVNAKQEQKTNDSYYGYIRLLEV